MCEHCMNRRQFGVLTTAGLTGGMLAASAGLAADGTDIEPWDPDKPPRITGRPLRVQPVLAHAIMSRREKTSWRSWSEIVNEEAAAEEMQRIAGELKALSAEADFPLEILPTAKVTTREQAANVQQGDFDVVLLYAASNASLFQPCCAADPQRDTVVFVRHKSGPTYYGYECLGVRHFQVPSPELWRRNSADNHGEVTLDDVVVDDYDDVLWRLRALYGLQNFVGQRVVALGGPMGKWDSKAPDVARQRYKLDIVDASYDDLAARLRALAADKKFQQQCRCLDRPLPGHARHASGDQEGVRAAGVRPLRGVSAVAAGARGPGHHDQPMHGHHPLRLEHDRLHAAELAQRRRVHRFLRVGFRGGAGGDPAALHFREARVHAQFDLPP